MRNDETGAALDVLSRLVILSKAVSNKAPSPDLDLATSPVWPPIPPDSMCSRHNLMKSMWKQENQQVEDGRSWNT